MAINKDRPIITYENIALFQSDTPAHSVASNSGQNLSFLPLVQSVNFSVDIARANAGALGTKGFVDQSNRNAPDVQFSINAIEDFDKLFTGLFSGHNVRDNLNIDRNFYAVIGDKRGFDVSGENLSGRDILSFGNCFLNNVSISQSINGTINSTYSYVGSNLQAQRFNEDLDQIIRSISGLGFWVDASDSSTVLTDESTTTPQGGKEVTGFIDKASGETGTVDASNDNIGYLLDEKNGLNVLYASGGHPSAITFSNFQTNTGQFEAFALVNIQDTESQAVGFFGDANYQDGGFQFAHLTNGRIRSVLNSNGGQQVLTSSSTYIDQYTLVDVNYLPTNIAFHVNKDAETKTATLAGGLGSNPNDFKIFDGPQGGWTNDFVGYFAEGLVFNRKLTDDERSLVYYYFQQKWGHSLSQSKPDYDQVFTGSSPSINLTGDQSQDASCSFNSMNNYYSIETGKIIPYYSTNVTISGSSSIGNFLIKSDSIQGFDLNLPINRKTIYSLGKKYPVKRKALFPSEGSFSFSNRVSNFEVNGDRANLKDFLNSDESYTLDISGQDKGSSSFHFQIAEAKLSSQSYSPSVGSDIVADLGFSFELNKLSNPNTITTTENRIQLENGDFLITENGDFIIIES